MAVGAVNNKVSVPALHFVLWQRRTGDGTLQFDMSELGGELQVTKYTVSRVVNAMLREGRLLLMNPDAKSGKDRTYVVEDPARFPDEDVEGGGAGG